MARLFTIQTEMRMVRRVDWRRAVRAALVSIALAALGLAGACAAVDSVIRQPLPPSETLNLQAILIEGGGVMPGTQVVRLNWSPPDENLDIDFIVFEYSGNENGPWEEIVAKTPDSGFHEHGAIFSSGDFHYYRVFMIRGQEETPRTAPTSVWIPGRGALERAGPGQILPPNVTPTPLPGSDATATPLPTPSGDSTSPFMVVPPTSTPSVTATPTATPTRTPTPTPAG